MSDHSFRPWNHGAASLPQLAKLPDRSSTISNSYGPARQTSLQDTKAKVHCNLCQNAFLLLAEFSLKLCGRLPTEISCTTSHYCNSASPASEPTTHTGTIRHNLYCFMQSSATLLSFSPNLPSNKR